MKALSDPSRVRILKLLQGKELCVCEIQPVIGLAQSTVSKHMKLLEEAGLVQYRRDGSWILYKLSNGEESVYAGTMLEQLAQWLEDDSELENMLLELAELQNRPDCKS